MQSKDEKRKVTKTKKQNERNLCNFNNSIQFFVIYVPSQQLQGQLQTQHSADTSNYIMDKTQYEVKDK
jgi:hypothetical protein